MKRHLALAATLAAAFAPPSMAASSANFTLSNFTVTLFDLNPTDSVTPGIRWATPSPGYGSYVYGSAGDSVSGSAPSFGTFATQNWSSVSGSVSTDRSQASASVSEGSDPADPTSGATVSVSGSAAGITVLGSGGYSSFQAGSYAPYFSAGFSLTPQTLVVFSVQASGNATTTVGFQTDGSTYGTESAQAYGTLNITGSGPGGQTGSQSSGDTLSVSATYGYTYTYDSTTGQYIYTYNGQSQSISGHLSGSFLNFSDVSKDGSLNMFTYVSGSSGVAAVPEPETYALMLAGLGLVGLISRRRLARAA